LYSIEIHRILHKYIKLFFNVIAVEIERFLQSGHQLLYASVLDLHRQLFQTLLHSFLDLLIVGKTFALKNSFSLVKK
jgi:fido (protein-threonine AMPylation protein)